MRNLPDPSRRCPSLSSPSPSHPGVADPCSPHRQLCFGLARLPSLYRRRLQAQRPVRPRIGGSCSPADPLALPARIALMRSPASRRMARATATSLPPGSRGARHSFPTQRCVLDLYGTLVLEVVGLTCTGQLRESCEEDIRTFAERSDHTEVSRHVLRIWELRPES